MIKLLLSILSVYLFFTLLLYIFQRSFLYFPKEKQEHSFEQMTINSQDETIELIVLNQGHDNALIYFGGNAEAVINNAHDFSSRFSHVTTYLVNYRAYGGSTGKPTEAGNYADALAIYDRIKGNHAQISVIGRSLGSGIASYLAVNRPIENVAFITPYDSILNVAKNSYFIFPVKLLLKDVYDSASRAKDIQANVLVIAAENDLVIPMKHTQQLIDAFRGEQIAVKIIKDAGHNTISNKPDYFKALQDFL